MMFCFILDVRSKEKTSPIRKAFGGVMAQRYNLLTIFDLAVRTFRKTGLYPWQSPIRHNEVKVKLGFLEPSTGITKVAKR